jgi:ubiquinone/menaquinone biosynthesis C-methylase UbiE
MGSVAAKSNWTMANPVNYEAWYRTAKGRYVDRLEKDIISDLCRVKPGDKVLEIGCGTGHFSAYFNELGARVTGIDTSPDMLHTARDRFGSKTIDFSAGSAYKLPFEDGSFDLVAMITTLEFISDPVKALDEAFRVSKGRVFLGTLNKNSLLAMKRKKSGKKIWQEARFYSLKEILSFFKIGVKVECRSAIYLPLFNSNIFLGFRIWLEKLFSVLNMPGGAFLGILAERKL